MTLENLDFGSPQPNTGEYLRQAFPKIQANFESLDGRVTSLETDGVPGLAEHIADTSGAHDASAISFTHTAAGAVLRTLRAKVAERPVGVQDFLGVDPTGATDSTAGIAAAITAAGVGGALYFPAGVYIFSDHDADGKGLIQLSGQKWFGDGRATILRLDAATTDIDVLIDAEDFAEDYSIVDMRIDGNRDNITPAVDLYNHFFMIRGPRGGKRGLYQNLHLTNSWGRVLQTSNESVAEYAEDIRVDGVFVTNAGAKAISATRSRKVTISGCYAEVDPYTSSDHPGGVGDGNAGSGSCFECNDAHDVTIVGNHGIQIGASVIGPGIRFVNSSHSIKAFGNTIEDAHYLGFIQNANDIDFFGNTGRDIRGNAILIADADAEAGTCRRVRVHHNTIIDPTGAYVAITANNSAHTPEVECYIYENDFVQISGSPTHGIYNNGVISPAVSGTCLVYQWGNTFTGTIPNQFAGPAAADIRPEPPVSRNAVVTKTADFALGASENYIINNKTGSACVATLPSASGYTGREVTLKTVQPFPITSTASDVVPIEGGSAGTAIVQGVPGAWATLRSDGTNWVVTACRKFDWQIMGQSSVAASHTGNTTETTLATIAIPANRLGPNGRMRITAQFSYTNSANNKIIRARFGNTQFYAVTVTTTTHCKFIVDIGNRNSASSQVGGVTGIGAGVGASAGTMATGSIDTTADRNVTLTGQLADMGETITLESYSVELFYAP